MVGGCSRRSFPTSWRNEGNILFVWTSFSPPLSFVMSADIKTLTPKTWMSGNGHVRVVMFIMIGITMPRSTFEKKVRGFYSLPKHMKQVNRGAHGVSSFMLGTRVSSSEKPPPLSPSGRRGGSMSQHPILVSIHFLLVVRQHVLVARAHDFFATFYNIFVVMCNRPALCYYAEVCERESKG